MIDYINDGIYEVSDTCVVSQTDAEGVEESDPEVMSFEAKHGDCYIASAYETNATLLLSEKPKKIKVSVIGSGFNYGSTNFIDGAPKRLLILAEND